jgi:hypothetical protein
MRPFLRGTVKTKKLQGLKSFCAIYDEAVAFRDEWLELWAIEALGFLTQIRRYDPQLRDLPRRDTVPVDINPRPMIERDGAITVREHLDKRSSYGTLDELPNPQRCPIYIKTPSRTQSKSV